MTGRAAVAIGVVGVMAQGLIFEGVGGFGVFLLATVTCVALALLGARRPWQLAALVGVEAMAGVWLVRDSLWLRLISALLAIACLVAVTGSGNRSLFTMGWVRSAAMAVDGFVHALLTPVWLWIGGMEITRGRGRSRLVAVLRVGGLALPVVAVLLVLLAWGDAVFASVIDIDLLDWTIRAILFGTAATGFAWLARCVVVGTEPDPERPVRSRLSAAESAGILGSTAAVLVTFVAVQWYAGSDAGRARFGAAGVDYAEHARSGYFQLLAAVAVVVAVLVAVQRNSPPAQRRRALQRGVSLVIIGLTFCLIAIALGRLALYCEQFGLTMLRLACLPVAAWIAVTLVLLAISICGLGADGQWLPGACGTVLVAVVAGFAAVNPQQIVADYDLDHRGSVRLDLKYLTSMSDDAVPALITRLPEFDTAEQDYIRTRLCRRYAADVSLPWPVQSVSSLRAQAILAPLCAGAVR